MSQDTVFFRIREMKIEDYDKVYGLWMGIHGFRIRSIDDSRDGVARFLRRNPTTSMVAVCDGKIVGAILCGNDGRRGCLYHVCVDEAYRQHGIGKAMASACMEALRREQVNVCTLTAFKSNEIGNHFWQEAGWSFRDDLNYYDYSLNDSNI